MIAMTSQVTGVSIVYQTVCPGGDQRKHQSPASLGFVRGIHRWPMNSPHKGPVTRKCSHSMTSSCSCFMVIDYILFSVESTDLKKKKISHLVPIILCKGPCMGFFRPLWIYFRIAMEQHNMAGSAPNFSDQSTGWSTFFVYLLGAWHTNGQSVSFLALRASELTSRAPSLHNEISPLPFFYR